MRKLFELIVRIVRPREFHQLDFLKLMLANDAAHILPVRARLTAKAGSICSKRNGQTAGIEQFIPVQIRNRDLSRRNQPQLLLSMRNPEEIGGKLGKLSGPVHGFRIHHEGREDLDIAVLASVNIEHEIRQGAL